MSKVGDFWKANTTGSGRMAWPDDPVGPDALARRAFGATIVEAVDYWLSRADDLIDNSSSPTEPWKRASEDPSYHSTFAAMSDEQRDVVRKLVRDTGLGVVFSSLTNLDQRAPGRFDMSLVDVGADGLTARGRVHPAPTDLHDGLYSWVWERSAYRDALMSRTSTGRGGTAERWQVSGSRKQDNLPDAAVNGDAQS